MPRRFETNLRDKLNYVFSKLRTTEHNILSDNSKSFQRCNTSDTNPSSKLRTKFFIPAVSLRNEMKTTGFGLAILEILTLAGVIIETKHKGWTEWTLSVGWETKKVFVAMDGLSIDRHWSFSRMLTEVPLSFTKSYKQCLIFQQALTVVTEISGPLHMGFHMLQSIFVIFANFMSVCQNVIEWKKSNRPKFQSAMNCVAICALLLWKNQAVLHGISS